MEDEEKVDGETLGAEGDVETPTESTEETVDKATYQKQIDAYQAQKVRAEKAEAELRKVKSQPNPNGADPLDLIKLGKKLQNYSDEELDFLTETAKSKNPADVLKALENPFVQSGIAAHREKVEKEKTLKPNGTQGISDKPMSVSEKINTASTMGEKEELLKKYGLYRDPRPRSDSKRI